MYIDLSPSASQDGREAVPGFVIGYDESGRIVGIDIDQASRKLDLQAFADELVKV